MSQDEVLHLIGAIVGTATFMYVALKYKPRIKISLQINRAEAEIFSETGNSIFTPRLFIHIQNGSKGTSLKEPMLITEQGMVNDADVAFNRSKFTPVLKPDEHTSIEITSLCLHGAKKIRAVVEFESKIRKSNWLLSEEALTISEVYEFDYPWPK